MRKHFINNGGDIENSEMNLIEKYKVRSVRSFCKEDKCVLQGCIVSWQSHFIRVYNKAGCDKMSI